MSTAPQPVLHDETTPSAVWELPVVDGPRTGRRHRPTLAELEGIERIAWDEAYAKGHQAGLVAGEKEARRVADEMRTQVARLDALLNTLANPLQQLDDSVEQMLVQLAVTIARHLLRRELRIDPTQVIAIVRETVALLPLSPLGQRNVRVHLHPLDAAVVREKLSEPHGERAWTLIEDPVTSRGGCRVVTETAQIDARLEARLQAVISQMLGEDRVTEDRTTDDRASDERDNDSSNNGVKP